MKAEIMKLQVHGHSYVLIHENKTIAFAHPEDFSSDDTIGKLSIKNCDAIARGYDLDELAIDLDRIHPAKISTEDLIEIFKIGFNKALELLGDKKFNKYDMYDFAEYTWKYSERTHPEYNEDYFKQHTEWDVKIKMEPYYDGEFIDDGKTHPIDIKWKPELDESGCLILIRV